MSDDKRGFFSRLMRLAFFAAVIGAAVSVFRRREGLDLDEDEWQELPPPPSA